MSERGDRYEHTYDVRAAAGEDVHGEANFVLRLAPGSVLDAGCGTGRVGRELHRRGVEVVGLDVDAEMLATARARCPDVQWLEADVSTVDLGRTFELVLMAGNVINFVDSPHRRGAVLNLARHLAPGGHLVNGHSIRPDGCAPADLDRWAAEAGLFQIERWATWDRARSAPGDDYAVTVWRAGAPA